MKNSFHWMFAAILICGLTLTLASCNKEPKKNIVLASMTAIGPSLSSDSIMETYEYDADYRLVKMTQTYIPTGQIVKTQSYAYYDDRIVVEYDLFGIDNYTTQTCILDSKGRISHIDILQTDGSVSTYDYTYDANDHMLTETFDSDPESPDAVIAYTWDGNDMVKKSTLKPDGTSFSDNIFVPSDVAIQGFFSNNGNGNDNVLYLQGYFGKVTTHLPASETMITKINGINMIPKAYEYTYTLDNKGHITTCKQQSVQSSKENVTNYTFTWEKR